MRFNSLLITAGLAIGLAHPSFADVKPAALFVDNMVLQQGIKDPVWGTADAGEKVTVSIGDQKQTVDTAADGKWKVVLEPLKAGGPLEMTIAGNNTITVKNVAVGEVWVCSGQSNMEFRVNGTMNAKDEIAAADYPMIRSFTVRNRVAADPQADTTGKWDVCTPQTVGGFTAVGYFFARELNKKLGIPVGLIHSSWGGTPAESWTSRPAFEGDKVLAPILAAAQKRADDYPAALQRYKDVTLVNWQAAVDKAKADGTALPRKPREPAGGPNDPNIPAVLFNGMINPIIPFGIKGALWYQGESNAGQAILYRRLFATMIKDWRARWGEGDFPFFFVQLANFMKVQERPSEGGWAEIRESQMLTLALPHTGMAVINDIGDADNIHPKNKQEVGRRLALIALATEYGQPGEYSGPLYDSMTVDGNKIRLKFTHVGGGLVVKGDKLGGFAIAGADKKFVWADAQIDGDTVVVSSDQVPAPVAVHYAWANNPVVSLYNKEGLPASSFRSDVPPGP